MALAGLCIVTERKSPAQALAYERAVAMQAAVRRGQFELACPSASGTVLSQDLLQPALYRRPERAEYTIDIAGCSKRAVLSARARSGRWPASPPEPLRGDMIARFQTGGWGLT